MLRAKKKRLIRKNRMCDIQKVESICMDLSFGHSQYIDDIYASIYFIRNMLPLSNAFYHFGPRDVHFFSSSNVYSFLLSVEKEACIFSRQSFFFNSAQMPLLYLHRNVCMECNWMLYFACNALQIDFYPVRTYRNRHMNGKCIHQSFGCLFVVVVVALHVSPNLLP